MNREQKIAWVLVVSTSLPVTWCPALLIGAAFCREYGRSFAILIRYGRRSKGEQA